MDSNTLIFADLNTLVTAMGRSSKQTINKERRGLMDRLDRMDFVDTYRTLQPKTAECSFFSNTHGTFFRIDHILDQKSGLNLYQKL